MDRAKQLLYAILSFLFLVSFSLSPTGAQAQEEPGEFFLGLKGGVNQASFSGDNVSASSRQDAVGGVFVGFNVNEMLSVELDALYSKGGATGVTSTAGPNRSASLDLNDVEVALSYFEFPLLFKVTAPVEAVRVRGFAGPSFTRINGATINGEEERKWLQPNQKVSERFAFYDLRGVVGAELGLPLPLLADEIALDGRYQFGFVDIDREQGFQMNNRAFSGTLSLRFTL